MVIGRSAAHLAVWLFCERRQLINTAMHACSYTHSVFILLTYTCSLSSHKHIHTHIGTQRHTQNTRTLCLHLTHIHMPPSFIHTRTNATLKIRTRLLSDFLTFHWFSILPLLERPIESSVSTHVQYPVHTLMDIQWLFCLCSGLFLFHWPTVSLHIHSIYAHCSLFLKYQCVSTCYRTPHVTVQCETDSISVSITVKKLKLKRFQNACHSPPVTVQSLVSSLGYLSALSPWQPSTNRCCHGNQN